MNDVLILIVGILLLLAGVFLMILVFLADSMRPSPGVGPKFSTEWLAAAVMVGLGALMTWSGFSGIGWL